MDRRQLYDRIDALSDEAAKQCGLSYRAYVEIFSTMVNDAFSGAAPDVFTMAVEIAGNYDYAAPSDVMFLQEKKSLS
jgi:hypothetical protein